MNSLLIGTITRWFILAGIAAATSSGASAGTLSFTNHLGGDQMQCLVRLLDTSRWKFSSDLHKQMLSIAQVATVVLNNKGRADYIFVFEADGWCGTAGCPLLIGEVRADGTCGLLYDEAGGKSFIVLSRRDHGYLRIYAPCEARFDGHRYQQVREDCPSLDVPH